MAAGYWMKCELNFDVVEVKSGKKQDSRSSPPPRSPFPRHPHHTTHVTWHRFLPYAQFSTTHSRGGRRVNRLTCAKRQMISFLFHSQPIPKAEMST